jgi:hypothetical protein
MTSLRAPVLALLLPVACSSAPGGAAASGRGDGRLLHVNQHHQEASSWCWNAVSQAVLEYFGHSRTQTAIAEWASGGADIPNYETGSWTGTLDPGLTCPAGRTCHGVTEVLQHFMGSPVPDPVTGRALDDAEIGRQISTRLRPFIIRWGWDGGGGHFVVARGVEWDSSGTAYVTLMDPNAGYTVATSAWVRKGSAHTWTTTITVEGPAHPPVASLDGCGVMPWGHGLGPGQSILSCNQRYLLVMQHDGNLVLHDWPSLDALWSSDTANRGDYATLDERGTLAVYSGEGATPGTVSWTTTREIPHASLVVSDSGRLYLRDEAGAPVLYLR